MRVSIPSVANKPSSVLNRIRLLQQHKHTFSNRTIDAPESLRYVQGQHRPSPHAKARHEKPPQNPTADPLAALQTVIVARTDAEAASLLDNNVDPRDHPFIMGATVPGTRRVLQADVRNAGSVQVQGVFFFLEIVTENVVGGSPYVVHLLVSVVSPLVARPFRDGGGGGMPLKSSRELADASRKLIRNKC